jgi:phosphatidylserine/phosphatidylglycerophosphate/cardiolipin synthase-like enzyme
MIDNCKDYFWITTYAMDSSPAADTTLYKLIDAAERGVHVVLCIDNVQLWAKNELLQKLQEKGGKFFILNPQWQLQSIKKYFTKDVWRRHHEKLIISDNKTLIGSSNIEGSYADIKYGSRSFQDINYYT